MTRIALLGNSHLANWKGGWDRAQRDFPGFDLTFFAAAGERLAYCQPKGDRLGFEGKEVVDQVEMSSGGNREVIVADYDAFCIVGLGFSARTVGKLYWKWRADAHRSEKGRFTLVSDDCFLEALRGMLDMSLAMDLVRKIRSISDKPVVIGVQPAPSQGILRTSGLQPGIQAAREAGDDETLRATYSEACRHLEKEGVIVIEQPATTLASPLLSREEYEREIDAVLDLTHMNDAYGEIAVREFLSSGCVPFPSPPSPEPGLWGSLMGTLRLARIRRSRLSRPHTRA